MDASCKIQRSIHDVRLTYKYVSRILGTYQFRAVLLMNSGVTDTETIRPENREELILCRI